MRRWHVLRIATGALASVLVIAACSTSSPSRTTLVSAPPGLPLILFAGDRVRAADWSGREYLPPDGVPEPTSSAIAGVLLSRPAPDGSAVVAELMPSRMWARGAYVSARPTPPPNFDRAIWADDSSHLCGMTYNRDNSTSVWVADSAGAWSKIATAGSWVMNGGGPSIAACSWTNQRVAVADSLGGNGEADEVWLFSWNGQLLMDHKTSLKAPHIYTFSRDASVWADFDESTGDTTVRDLMGNQLGTLKSTFIEAFSWSGHYALAMDSSSDTGTRPIHNPYLMDWRSGQVFWRSPASTMLDTGIYGPVALQPNGDGFAFPIESTDCVNLARCNPALEIVSPIASWRFSGSPYLSWFINGP